MIHLWIDDGEESPVHSEDRGYVAGSGDVANKTQVQVGVGARHLAEGRHQGVVER